MRGTGGKGGSNNGGIGDSRQKGRMGGSGISNGNERACDSALGGDAGDAMGCSHAPIPGKHSLQR
jgi:hypothetical protein